MARQLETDGAFPIRAMGHMVHSTLFPLLGMYYGVEAGMESGSGMMPGIPFALHGACCMSVSIFAVSIS